MITYHSWNRTEISCASKRWCARTPLWKGEGRRANEWNTTTFIEHNAIHRYSVVSLLEPGLQTKNANARFLLLRPSPVPPPGLLLALRGLAAGYHRRRVPHFASFLSACYLNPKTSSNLLELHSQTQELPTVAWGGEGGGRKRAKLLVQGQTSSGLRVRYVIKSLTTSCFSCVCACLVRSEGVVVCCWIGLGVEMTLILELCALTLCVASRCALVFELEVIVPFISFLLSFLCGFVLCCIAKIASSEGQVL